jgi:hypothetical protein
LELFQSQGLSGIFVELPGEIIYNMLCSEPNNYNIYLFV